MPPFLLTLGSHPTCSARFPINFLVFHLKIILFLQAGYFCLTGESALPVNNQLQSIEVTFSMNKISSAAELYPL